MYGCRRVAVLSAFCVALPWQRDVESGFTVPTQRPKVAYLIEKGCPAEKLGEIIGKAQEERAAGKQVLVVRMNKNKKFQKEKLDAEGYKEIVEYFNK